MGDFVVEAIAGGDDGDFCVGVEEVEDAAGCYLGALERQCQRSARCMDREVEGVAYLAAADY